jgi:hypothetical protein
MRRARERFLQVRLIPWVLGNLHKVESLVRIDTQHRANEQSEALGDVAR